jgi:PKD repeat protein
MANDNHALVSPVGAVWKYIRTNFPLIELYNADESHPSFAGSYAAACTFYTTIFREDPTAISYIGSLDSITASSIRSAVKAMVFDSLSSWNVGNYDPQAQFTSVVSGDSVQFANESLNADSYTWDFGDGSTDTSFESIHVYATDGVYPVTLTAGFCDMSISVTDTVAIITSKLEELSDQKWIVYPNPVSTKLFLSKDPGQLFLYSATGANINCKVIKEGSISYIDLSKVKDGIYFLKSNKLSNVVVVEHSIEK